MLANAFIPNPHNKRVVDHIDNNSLNNSLINLRWATDQENQRNTKICSKNTSGVKGVGFHKSKNKWRASIKINGKLVQIGSYHTLEEAKEARQAKAKQLFGEFANKCEL